MYDTIQNLVVDVYETNAYLLLVFFLLGYVANAQTTEWLKELILAKGSPLLKNVIEHPDSFKYQIIYTQINRDNSNVPYFTNYYLNVDRRNYFNPASTVKLPVVLMSLEKLNTLDVRNLTKYSVMLTDSSYYHQASVLKDSTSENGLPSIANYIRKNIIG